ncbi:similar to Saccharomyces cerevisiae YDL230W PTP1 Phosphotyrosine-specific protein phosphatase that dephosphorylates a broad range of substrates in vivo, including Fpr3p [Maudiozyma saulgeensis]|uniref:protein-tyrosine-phosphatase n=1 Tax=Maudiozyma saulgeensis TaxID=1789683 RepID=A0A1X7R7B1_9SACH|nr:similar to Saccharomyces cerevisiae YDL230W PTP1 Phosphotyrosine-specific protein phosphatase that dephosphorylates a broad range of substrates in vivo, including Fpr3p [Kazachstania saulgeensis]
MSERDTRTPWYLTQPEEELVHKFNYIQHTEDSHLREATNGTKNSKWSLGVSIEEQNDYRNRYVNIMPYERNRVKLPVAKGNDYINGSYVKVDVDGQSTAAGHYIATQGPTKYTWQQFWQMCYHECQSNDIVIVMVTPLVERGREKCFPYWPQGMNKDDMFKIIPRVQSPGGPDDTSVFKTEMKVDYVNSSRFDDNYTLTTMNLAPTDGNLGPKKKVHHFYFDQWKDMSRPEEIIPIMELSRHSHKLNVTGSPIIVHCSAGVGRSGTFIALDHLLHDTKDFMVQDNNDNKGKLRMLKPVTNYKKDLIEQIVSQLRSQRMKMVQLKDQYVFIYHAAKLLYSLDCDNTLE